MKRLWPFLLFLLILTGTFADAAPKKKTKKPSSTAFLSGRDYVLGVRSPTTLSWNDAPIRETLQRLEEMQKIAVFLDRRVDPGLRLNCNVKNKALPAIVRYAMNTAVLTGSGTTAPQAGQAAQTGQKPQGNAHVKVPFEVSQLGGALLYAGPAGYVSHLRTIAAKQREAIRKLPENLQEKWLKRATLSWEELAEPREILTKMAKKAGVKITNPELVPHDLWPEKRLPALPLVDRWILLLGQFDLTFQIDEDGTVTLLPLDLSQYTLTETYKKTESLDEKLELVRELYPDTEISKSKSKVTVTGIQEVHEYLNPSMLASDGILIGGFAVMSTASSEPTASRSKRASSAEEETDDTAASSRKGSRGKTGSSSRRSRRQTAGNAQPGRVLMSGKMEGPFFPILKQFCQNQGLELECDADALVRAGVDLEKRIKVEVKEVSLEELLQKLAENTDCKVTKQGDKVRLEKK